jgi:hypothetical protein
MTNLFKGKTYEGTSFIIDKVYSNKKAMDNAIGIDENNKQKDDGVFIGRYVLVSYTDKALNQDEKIAIEVALNKEEPVGVYSGVITKDTVNNFTSTSKYYNYI